MGAKLQIKGGLWIFWMISLIQLIHTASAAGQSFTEGDARLYAHGDTLKLNASIDGLFSQRTLDAIESGMTATILLQFRLETLNGNRILEQAIALNLEHDIWEGQYRITRDANATDTLQTTSWDTVQAYCSSMKGLVLGPFPAPLSPMLLSARIDVNPVPPEQEERTRKWLNLLERGSLLEFFISLDRSSERPGDWMQVARFNPETEP